MFSSNKQSISEVIAPKLEPFPNRGLVKSCVFNEQSEFRLSHRGNIFYEVTVTIDRMTAAKFERKASEHSLKASEGRIVKYLESGKDEPVSFSTAVSYCNDGYTVAEVFHFFGFDSTVVHSVSAVSR